MEYQYADEELDARRIVTALEANVIESDTIQGSEISEQRQRNHTYYSLDGLGNEKSGRSQHLSADVLDSVESQKAFYMEAFGEGRRPLRFQPENSQDMTARVSTEYVTQMFVDDQDGYGFLRDSLHDAFVAKKTVAHVQWRKKFIREKAQFQGPLPQLHSLLATEQYEGIEGSPSPIDPEGKDPDQNVRATLIKSIDRSYAECMLLRPETFYRDPNATHVRTATFAGWHDDYARWELIERGFPEDEVMELKIDYRFRQQEEDAARKSHDSSWSRQRRHKREAETETVTLYTHYAWLSLSNFDTSGEVDPTLEDVKLYKFYWSQGRLLTNPVTGKMYECIEDGDMPFEEWTQYKISHAEHGLCDADLAASIQWDKSMIGRQIIDNAAMNNTSRWKARHSFIKNPRELLDNNIGSVLWVKDMDALEPLPTAPLTPVTFNLLEVLDTEKENRTGMSRLAKGLNSDAISHQNAADMIQRLTNASNRRTLRGVRDYAQTFLRPIFIRMHNLGVKNDTRQRMMTYGGQTVPVQPKQLPMRHKMNVSVALTPDEGREQAMTLMQLHAFIQQDPELSKMYTADRRYNMITEIFDSYGFADAGMFLRPSGDPVVQQIQGLIGQIEQMQQQLAQRDMGVKEGDLARKWFETRAKVADMASDNLREDNKYVHEIRMDEEELELERQQMRQVSIGDRR